MTKFETLVSQSSLAVILAGTPQFDRFILLPLGAPSDDAVVAAQECGLRFMGVLTLDKQFVPRTALAEELPEESMSAIADAFIGFCQRALATAEEIHSLQKIHDLPDTREN